jgi:hypothetical protein
MRPESLKANFTTTTVEFNTKSPSSQLARYITGVLEAVESGSVPDAIVQLANFQGDHRPVLLQILEGYPFYLLAKDVFELIKENVKNPTFVFGNQLKEIAIDYTDAAQNLSVVTVIPVEAALITIRAIKSKRQLRYLDHFLSLSVGNFDKLRQECKLNIEEIDKLSEEVSP